MKIKYSYLEEQFADSGPILEKIAQVVKTGDFTLGKAVAAFEAKFAALVGTRFAVGVNSGTDALFLSLKAAGVSPGHEVITAPNTFIATAGAIAATGARPVFADVTDEYVLDPDKIEAAVTDRTRAIVPVHYAGVCADMDRIMGIAQKRDLAVVEDACQAIGASLDGKKAGSFGLAGAFSLHPLKNLNVWGDSGMIVTNSPEVCEKLRLLRNHGLVNRDESAVFGYNSRLDSVQAVVGLHLIGDFEWITQTRVRWAQKLDQELSRLTGFVHVPRRDPRKRYVHHLYMVQVKDRDRLLAHLEAQGVEAKIHYPTPLHLQPCSAHLGYKAGDFPVAEAQAQAILTLPVHQHLKEDAIDYMANCIRKFYA